MDLYIMHIKELKERLSKLYFKLSSLDMKKKEKSLEENYLDQKIQDENKKLNQLKYDKQFFVKVRKHFYLKDYIKRVIPIFLAICVLTGTLILAFPTSNFFSEWLIALLINFILNASIVYSYYQEDKKHVRYPKMELVIKEEEITQKELQKLTRKKEKIKTDITQIIAEAQSLFGQVSKLEQAINEILSLRNNELEQIIQDYTLFEEELNESFQNNQNVLKLIRELNEEE